MKVLSALLVLSVIGLSSAQFFPSFGSLSSLLTTPRPSKLVSQAEEAKAQAEAAAAAAKAKAAAASAAAKAQAEAAAAAAAKAQAEAQARLQAAKAQAEAQAKLQAAKAQAEAQAKLQAAKEKAKADAAAATQQAKDKIDSAASAVLGKIEINREKLKDKWGSAVDKIRSGVDSAKDLAAQKWEQFQNYELFKEAELKFKVAKDKLEAQLKEKLANHPKIQGALDEAGRRLKLVENKAHEVVSSWKEKVPELKNAIDGKLKEWNITLPF